MPLKVEIKFNRTPSDLEELLSSNTYCKVEEVYNNKNLYCVYMMVEDEAGILPLQELLKYHSYDLYHYPVQHQNHEAEPLPYTFEDLANEDQVLKETYTQGELDELTWRYQGRIQLLAATPAPVMIRTYNIGALHWVSGDRCSICLSSRNPNLSEFKLQLGPGYRTVILCQSRFIYFSAVKPEYEMVVHTKLDGTVTPTSTFPYSEADPETLVLLNQGINE